MKDLGFTSNLDVINRFVPIEGKFVIDAGCGGLTFTRLLLEQGARVLAIDPDPVQAEHNRAAEPLAQLEFIETGADQIPVESNNVDGVFFSYSLHHIPAEIYPQVFSEVFRVLKPDGFLYVIEPIGCPLNDVMKLFYDEDQEREAAWRALERLAMPAFVSAEVVTYHGYSQYDSFDHFARQLGGRSFNALYTEADIRRPEVEAAFQRLGGPDHRFASPKQVMFLQGLKEC
jgi:ubiquinone/menaquinone biosynthesis C-methylase UbiE